MTLRIVRLGTPRAHDEGLRIGTVRRPPRGVPKERFASDDWYDVWFPTLAPTVETMKIALASKSAAEFAVFARRFKSELAEPDARHALALVAALSRTSNLSLGCYCTDESRCHRSILRQLLTEAGADIEPLDGGQAPSAPGKA
jgi:uncharacterized protein YeaO (DUF488 family)